MSLAVHVTVVMLGVRLIAMSLRRRDIRQSPSSRAVAVGQWIRRHPSVLFAASDIGTIDTLEWTREAVSSDGAIAVALFRRVAVIALGLAIFVATGATSWGATVAVVTVIAAMVVVQWWEARSVSAWRTRANADVPLVADLLAAGFATTGSPPAALAVALRAAPQSLRPLLAWANCQAEFGSAPFGALRMAGERARLSPLVTLAAAIERDVGLGVPVAGRLNDLADELRSVQNSARIARAGKVVPLATLISAMVIAPACVVILAVLVVGGGLLGGLGAAPG